MNKIIIGLFTLVSIPAFAFEVNSVKEFNVEASYCEKSKEENERLAKAFIESMSNSPRFKVRSIELVNCDDFSIGAKIQKVRVIYRMGHPPKPPKSKKQSPLRPWITEN